MTIAKTTLTLLVMMLMAMTAWAEQVTEEQARQQALEFLTSHWHANGARRAPNTMPQFTTIRQVSGLYEFNMGDDGDFVIVSNDDRAIPVLGYRLFGKGKKR